MNRTALSRLEALERAHEVHGMGLATALRALRALRKHRPTFATHEAWLAFKAEQQSAWRLAPALSAALKDQRERRHGAAHRVTSEELDRRAWRAERGRYLVRHPEEVRSELDRGLAAEASDLEP